MKIFVAKLPPDYDETDIATLFITYGDISTINLVTDRETGRSKGYAFIEMPNDEEALNAISHLDQKQISNNRQLSVSQAQERPRPAGNGGGGFNRSAKPGGFQRGSKPYGQQGQNRGQNNYNRDRRPNNNGGFNRHDDPNNKSDY
jgi:cold-inducible RNA-binding protein